MSDTKFLGLIAMVVGLLLALIILLAALTPCYGEYMDYLIISPKTYMDEWEGLQDWKSQKGLKSEVRSIGWICTTYISGTDTIEAVRTYLEHCYKDSMLQYVLLGADAESLPTWEGYKRVYNAIPASQPKSCLFDGVYSNVCGRCPPEGDTINTFLAYGYLPWWKYNQPDSLYVGRISATAPSQIARVIARIKKYEQNPDDSYLNGAWWTAYTQFWADIIEDTNLVSALDLRVDSVCGTAWGDRDSIIDTLHLGQWNFIHVHCHGNNGTGQWTGNSGCNALNSWAVTDWDDINVLGERFFNLLNVSCWGGQVMAGAAHASTCEQAVLSDSAAISAIGSGTICVADETEADYYKCILDSLIKQPGRVLHYMRLQQSKDAAVELALHGDPEFTIWADSLHDMTITTIPDSLFTGSNKVSLNVRDGADSLSGVLCCFYANNDTFWSDTTDTIGNVTLYPNLPAFDSVYFTASPRHHDCQIQIETLAVDTNSGDFVAVIGQIVADSSFGNNNGKAEVGEVVTIQAIIKNYGAVNSAALSCTLRVLDGSVTILDSVVSNSAVNAGVTDTTGTGEFKYQISNFGKEFVKFEISIGDGGANWQSSFTDTLICRTYLANLKGG